MVTIAVILLCLWFVSHSCLSTLGAVHATHDACDTASDACNARDSLLASDAQTTLNGRDSIQCSQSFMQLAVGSAIAAEAPAIGARLPSTSPSRHEDAIHSTAKATALVQHVLHQFASKLPREFAKRETPSTAVWLILSIGVIGGMIIACGLMLLFKQDSSRVVLERESTEDSSAPKIAQQARTSGTPGTGSPASVAEYEALRCPKLCHGLVVPLGSECVLAVRPAHLHAGRPSAPNVEVFDMNGKPVLRVDLKRPLNWAEALENPTPSVVKPAVTLRMLSKFDSTIAQQQSPADRQGVILARCREAKRADGQDCMYVYDSQEQVFACLTKDPEKQQRYLLSSIDADFEIIFDGIFRDYAMLIYNKRQEQLADAEPCRLSVNLHEQFYKLQINSGVDVGLIICCLVAIDEMEASLHSADGAAYTK